MASLFFGSLFSFLYVQVWHCCTDFHKFIRRISYHFGVLLHRLDMSFSKMSTSVCRNMGNVSLFYTGVHVPCMSH